MMDCNYSKVDIDSMVADLEINDSNKEQLKKTLRKFENGLFGGGLGKLKNCKPVHIKLKPGATPYKGRYYNLPKVMNTHVRKAFNVWSILESLRNFCGMMIAPRLHQCS